MLCTAAVTTWSDTSVSDAMTPEQIDKLVAEAQERMRHFINRITGQNLRRMREQWTKTTATTP